MSVLALTSTTTVTEMALLGTGIKNSAHLWKEQPLEMQVAVAKYDEILNTAIKAHKGMILGTPGNALYAAFEEPQQALRAAYESQAALSKLDWGTLKEPLQVSAAIHFGEITLQNGQYNGSAFQQIKRIQAVGNSGTILASPAARQKLGETVLPENLGLFSVGEHRLQDLTPAQELFEVRGDLLPQVSSRLNSLDSWPHNLPFYLYQIIGREKEVASALEMLNRRNVRLITFTGPGGSGKTRLSQQVAAETLFDFPDGVFLVELAGIHQPGQVAMAISRTLGLEDTSGREQLANLKTFLRDRHILLVLDNFEQVVAAAPLVSELMAAAPHLKVLVSSRILLKIYGEQEFEVPPLQLPGVSKLTGTGVKEIGSYPAVELLLERVRQVLPNFILTQQNAPVIGKICARLDGLPLAIELAAVRFKMFKPEIILSGLTNRLQLLVDDADKGLGRQKTLRGTIDWSYSLLEDSEKLLFARLGIFAGGFTSEVAERVCNPDFEADLDTLDDLTSIIDHSLVRVISGPEEDEPRFGMLETIREFALERLADRNEQAEMAQNYADYFLELAEEAEPQLTGADQIHWFRRLAWDYPNFREVIELAQSPTNFSDHVQGLKLSLQITSALWRFWAARGYIAESRDWLEKGLIKTISTQEENSSSQVELVSLRAKGYTAAGLLALEEGDFNQAKALLEEALRLHNQNETSASLANILNALGTVESYLGNLDQALESHNKCLQIRKTLKDTRGIAISLCNMGALAAAQNQTEQARKYYQEALSLLRRVGDKRTMALLLNNLGNLWLAERNFEKARQVTEESRKIYQELEDQGGLALVLMQLGDISRGLNQPSEAIDLYRQSLLLFGETGEKADLPPCLEGLAAAMNQTGSFKEAACLYGVARALREQLDSPIQPADLTRYTEELDALKGHLSEPDFSAAWSNGFSASFQDILKTTLEVF